MDLRIYKEAEQFVFDSFNKAEKSSQIKHFVQTVHWLKVLSPEADEALLVAAIAHDIERAFRQKDVLEKKTLAGLTSIEFYRPHEERGAEIIADFLKHQNVDDSFIERVKKLVSRHEDGGDDDQNLLKDADSVSFFETNAPFFVNNPIEISKESVKEKFDWMFNRITLEKAKQIARPLYEKAIKDLNASHKFGPGRVLH
jgi:hypothetical protein